MSGTFGLFVYLIINLLDGKLYVGQTRRTVEIRWSEHVTYALRFAPGNPHLDAAIRKYGPESFSVETLATASTLEELDELEIFWIDRLGTLNRNLGYNLNSGGKHPVLSQETRDKISLGGMGRVSPYKGVPIPKDRYEKIKASGIWERSATNMSEESRLRLSEARKGDKNPNFGGKGMTPEGIEKVAAVLRIKYKGEGNPNWGGKSVTEESRRKLSESLKGRQMGPDNHRYRRDVSDEDIKRLRDEGFTHQQIADRFNFSRRGISKRLRKYPGYV